MSRPVLLPLYALAQAPVSPRIETGPVVGEHRAPEGEAKAKPLTGPTDLSVPALHTAGLFLGMRLTEAYLWPRPFAETRPRVWLDHYGDAFTLPPLFDSSARAFEWDHDRWTLNVFGHGLLGSELYYRPRRCAASPLVALAFAAGASVVWEYAFEGNAVRPSALDLVYTPLAGMFLGEVRFWTYSAAQSIGSRPLRTVLQSLLDPFGEIERAAGAPC